jgi:hypothetical protein
VIGGLESSSSDPESLSVSVFGYSVLNHLPLVFCTRACVWFPIHRHASSGPGPARSWQRQAPVSRKDGLVMGSCCGRNGSWGAFLASIDHVRRRIGS